MKIVTLKVHDQILRGYYDQINSNEYKILVPSPDEYGGLIFRAGRLLANSEAEVLENVRINASKYFQRDVHVVAHYVNEIVVNIYKNDLKVRVTFDPLTSYYLRLNNSVIEYSIEDFNEISEERAVEDFVYVMTNCSIDYLTNKGFCIKTINQ